MNKVPFIDWEEWYYKVQNYPARIQHISGTSNYRAIFNGVIVGAWDFKKKEGWIAYAEHCVYYKDWYLY